MKITLQATRGCPARPITPIAASERAANHDCAAARNRVLFKITPIAYPALRQEYCHFRAAGAER